VLLALRLVAALARDDRMIHSNLRKLLLEALGHLQGDASLAGKQSKAIVRIAGREVLLQKLGRRVSEWIDDLDLWHALELPVRQKEHPVRKLFVDERARLLELVDLTASQQ
jgi:hypothetical protein